MTPTINASLSDNVQWQLTCIRFEEWMKTDVFRLKWWFLLVIFMASLFIWWKLVDKSRLKEILLFGGLITLVTLSLDELGEELSLWYYPVELFPLFPPMFSVDLASLPMILSLIYMYFKGWGKFTIAIIITSLIFCFVLEPLLVLTGVYQPLTWRYYYGLPIYIAMPLLAKLLIMKLNYT